VTAFASAKSDLAPRQIHRQIICDKTGSSAAGTVRRSARASAQEFAYAERFGHVIVRARVERGDLVGLLPAHRKMMMGMRVHSRSERVTSIPSRSGRPRSRMTRSAVGGPADSADCPSPASKMVYPCAASDARRNAGWPAHRLRRVPCAGLGHFRRLWSGQREGDDRAPARPVFSHDEPPCASKFPCSGQPQAGAAHAFQGAARGRTCQRPASGRRANPHTSVAHFGPPKKPRQDAQRLSMGASAAEY